MLLLKVAFLIWLNYVLQNCLFTFTDDQYCSFQSCIYNSDSNTRIIKWQECIELCCPMLANSDLPHEASQIDANCARKDVQDDELTILEISFIIVGVTITIIIIYLIVTKQYQGCCACLRKNEKANQNIGAIKYNLSEIVINGESQLFRINDAIKENKTVSQDVQIKICCICLLPNTNMQTQCKHQLHAWCLREWIRRGRGCPICRSPIRRFRIICAKCQKGSLIVRPSSKYLTFECEECKR